MGKDPTASGFGMRRISWVRIDLTGDSPQAVVAGVGQHRPVTRTVPLGVASALAAAGVPTYVRRPAPADADLAGVG